MTAKLQPRFPLSPCRTSGQPLHEEGMLRNVRKVRQEGISDAVGRPDKYTHPLRLVVLRSGGTELYDSDLMIYVKCQHSVAMQEAACVWRSEKIFTLLLLKTI